jgi:hypothetical protein
MTPRLAIFYHCLFFLGEPPKLLEKACTVVTDQMRMFKASGLCKRADEFHVGVNGTTAESGPLVDDLIPKKARVTYHGLQSRSENLTLVELEKWLPGHEDWYVLYFHAKTATHLPGHNDGPFGPHWLHCMMKRCVHQWPACVELLSHGQDAVGCHWMTNMGPDKDQHIFGGNFWWARADFLLTLPSLFERHQIKTKGIGALESRFEAEVWIGNGPRLPRVKDLEPNHRMWQCPPPP